ncbi:NADH-quinone oxidoreductase subunit N [Gammaproteobacteria bacterium]|nr:NADH-quinone oxidoreductase subunit N [Gammaproteobacteria bacterium]
MTDAIHKFDLTVILPEIFLLIMLIVVLLNDCFSTKSAKNKDSNKNSDKDTDKQSCKCDPMHYLSIFGLLGAALLIIISYGNNSLQTFGNNALQSFWSNQIFSARYIDLLKATSLIIVAVGLIYSRASLIAAGLYKAEFYVLAMLGTLGMMVLISAASLLTIYLGLELMSLSMYAMVAFNKNSTKSTEAAMKYFVMGSMASGILLYGMALLYGATGSIYISEIVYAIPEILAQDSMETNKAILMVAMVFLIIGIAFKFGAVPYHSWVPDVYEGAVTPVTIYIATAPKLAAICMAFLLLNIGMNDLFTSWNKILIIICVLSFALGNLVALMQTNIKRMLAYSAISHAGFILLGLAANAPEAAAFYGITYALTTLAALGILMSMNKNGLEINEIADLKGLATRYPWLAFLMLCTMFSLAGVPILVGFYSKFYILKSLYAFDNMLPIVMIALIFSVIGLFYYLRVVKVMYFDEPQNTEVIYATTMANKVFLSVNSIGLIALGLYPSALLALCQSAFS